MTRSILRGVARWFAPAGVPIAWRQLLYDRNRLIAAVAGIALAVTAILFQTGAYNALFDSVALQYGALNADLVVHSTNFRDLVVHSLFSRDRLIAARSDPDVTATEGVTSNVALWRLPNGNVDQVLVFGIDPAGTAFNNPEIGARSAGWRCQTASFGTRCHCRSSAMSMPASRVGGHAQRRPTAHSSISAAVSRSAFLLRRTARQLLAATASIGCFPTRLNPVSPSVSCA